MPEPYTVVLADDDGVLLASLQELLAEMPELDVLAAVTSGDEALHECSRRQPDLVVLDVRMPGGGPPVVEWIRSACPATRVVVLTATADVGVVAAMMTAGATGLFSKTELPGNLGEALVRCARGAVLFEAPAAAEAMEVSLARWPG